MEAQDEILDLNTHETLSLVKKKKPKQPRPQSC